MSKNKMPNMKEWREKRYKIFNEKINHFSFHKDFQALRKYADNAMINNEGFGLQQIRASDFIERIEQASLEYIKGWLDGKNQLEWSGINGNNSEIAKQN